MEAVLTTVLLLTGVLFVLCVLGWLWVGERHRMVSEELGPAERAWVAREAGELLAELAPGAIVLAEKERVVQEALRDEEDIVLEAAVRRRLGRIGLRSFWEDFTWAAVLVERDPARAVRELPGLRTTLEEGLESCDEVLGMLGAGSKRAEPVERGEGRAGS